MKQLGTLFLWMSAKKTLPRLILAHQYRPNKARKTQHTQLRPLPCTIASQASGAGTSIQVQASADGNPKMPERTKLTHGGVTFPLHLNWVLMIFQALSTIFSGPRLLGESQVFAFLPTLIPTLALDRLSRLTQKLVYPPYALLSRLSY